MTEAPKSADAVHAQTLEQLIPLLADKALKHEGTTLRRLTPNTYILSLHPNFFDESVTSWCDTGALPLGRISINPTTIPVSSDAPLLDKYRRSHAQQLNDAIAASFEGLGAKVITGGWYKNSFHITAQLGSVLNQDLDALYESQNHAKAPF